MEYSSQELLDFLKNKVLEAYGSLDQPTSTFRMKMEDRNPYSLLIAEIRKKCSKFEEITDINYDVCFRYLLKSQNAQWVLELSMVGLFATFSRLSRFRRTSSEIINYTQADNCMERYVVGILRKNQILLISRADLKKKIPLSNLIIDKEDATYYHALFSDVESLPW